MTDLARVAALATMGLGASQALVPQTTAKVFGLDELNGQGVWLARLLGVANLALGAMSLDERLRAETDVYVYGLLAGNAVATVAATASGALPKRTAAMVLPFLAGLAGARAADG